MNVIRDSAMVDACKCVSRGRVSRIMCDLCTLVRRTDENGGCHYVSVCDIVVDSMIMFSELNERAKELLGVVSGVVSLLHKMKGKRIKENFVYRNTPLLGLWYKMGFWYKALSINIANEYFYF